MKKQQAFGCTPWPVLFCLAGIKNFMKLCAVANCLPGCFHKHHPAFHVRYLQGPRDLQEVGQGPDPSVATRRLCVRAKEVPVKSLQGPHGWQNLGSCPVFLFLSPQERWLYLFDWNHLVMSGSSDTREHNFKNSFPDFLAQPSSSYGVGQPHFGFVSRHVSSLFINSKVLPFLLELPSLSFITDTFFSPSLKL